MNQQCDFTTMEVQKAGSRVYLSRGFVYNLKRTNANNSRLTCALKSKLKCKATGLVHGDNFTLEVSHNHSIDDHRVDEMVLKNLIKTNVSESVEPIKDIFDRICRENPDIAPRISYSNFCRTLQNHRLKNFPRVPKTIQEFVVLIRTSDNLSKYLQGFYTVSESSCGPIFFSQQVLDVVGEINGVSFDGTFFTCPRLFHQIFIIFANFRGKHFPIIFTLMQSRTKVHYCALIDKIVSLVPTFNPMNLMSDFEQASIMAFQEKFPGIQASGCLFHFKQANMKKLASLGLKVKYQSDSHFKQYIDLLLSIPHLPANLIPSTASSILSVEFPELGAKFEEYKDYFIRYWVPKSEIVSIFNSAITTNNFAESFNGKMKRKIKIHHPNPWIFTVALNEVIEDSEIEIQRHRLAEAEHRTNDHQRSNIVQLRRELLDGLISPLEFTGLICDRIPVTEIGQDRPVSAIVQLVANLQSDTNQSIQILETNNENEPNADPQVPAIHPTRRLPNADPQVPAIRPARRLPNSDLQIPAIRPARRQNIPVVILNAGISHLFKIQTFRYWALFSSSCAHTKNGCSGWPG